MGEKAIIKDLDANQTGNDGALCRRCKCFATALSVQPVSGIRQTLQ